MQSLQNMWQRKDINEHVWPLSKKAVAMTMMSSNSAWASQLVLSPITILTHNSQLYFSV